jgi:UDP:flavonoid glycosyltransferase YjiC (YdhE family)
MHITVVTCGSRGDVQPMLGLAVGCGAAGHEVTVCSSPDYGDWARSLGCTFEASTNRQSCEEPHGVLFPRVRAVIHHGGAGTVATAARAGVPQIVLPQAADQFLWRGQVVRLGLGPRAPMLRFASAASVARAITAALADPGYRRRAQKVAARLQAAPDGVAAAVAEITRRTVVEA